MACAPRAAGGGGGRRGTRKQVAEVDRAAACKVCVLGVYLKGVIKWNFGGLGCSVWLKLLDVLRVAARPPLGAPLFFHGEIHAIRMQQRLECWCG